MKKFLLITFLLVFLLAACTPGNDGTDGGDIHQTYTVTVICDGKGTAKSSKEKAAAGETITLTATPASGSEFEQWTIESGGITLSDNHAYQTTFTMPAKDVSVKASFAETFSGSDILTIKWDGLELFELSSVSGIDIITEDGTEQCELEDGKITISCDPSSITGIRIYFSDGATSIYLNIHDFTITGGVISITRDVPADVILVYDRATLESVRNNLAGNYLQICDIDLSGSNLTPIGPSFTGTYDGGNFTINNMNVYVYGGVGTAYAGLFCLNRGTLRNIHIGETCSVEAYGYYVYCGGVCGENISGAIISCHNAGKVKGMAAGTQLVGVSPLLSCGGVCGETTFGMIISCYNTGNVEGYTTRSFRCGGVCGSTYRGTIISCYNTGNLDGTSSSNIIGGVCGRSEQGTIISCYNTGNIHSMTLERGDWPSLGGVCGWNSGTIASCYNTGSGKGLSESGMSRGSVSGICSSTYNYGTIAYCFWGGDNVSSDGNAYRFSGTDGTGWPAASLPGWGDTAPDGWDVETLGVWSNPWSSLGGWNNGNPVYPTLKNI